MNRAVVLVVMKWLQLQVFLKASLFSSCINNDGSIAALSLSLQAVDASIQLKQSPLPESSFCPLNGIIVISSSPSYIYYIALINMSYDKTKMHILSFTSALIIIVKRKTGKNTIL